MSIERFKICLDSLLEGGKTCTLASTPIWTGLGDVEISCMPGTGCKCVEIQVPSDSINKCFTVQVDCDDCDKCPPQIITKCLCSTNDNCGPCEVCINGQCVSRCPDKVCDEDRNICVDCINDVECPDGKICNAGRCQCPPNKPFQDITGRCVKCKSNGDCPPCTECVDGDCIPKNCGPGECNPTTGDCVDCVSSGTCTKPNQCCINNKCQCCDGFIYNPVTDTCEEAGECREDNQCPECFICVGRECLPRICPTGYVCINDNCEKTCECSVGPCSKTESCVPYNSDICYCNKCEGDCTTNANCGFGCFCDNGTCKPNPCANVACGSSLDCGEGCGCNNGVCIPCNSFNCENDECSQVEGCKCFGTLCKQDPCSGPCVNGADCGDGCGCFNGVCVSCDKQSCVGNDCKDVLGCSCIGNNCVDKQGCEGGCSVASDCGIGCTCYQGQCTPCADFPCNECDTHDGCACLSDTCVGDGTECNEADIVITQVDTCELKGSVQLDQCCTCEPIDYVVEQKKTGSTLVFSVGLYKFGTKLSELPIQNEDEYVGQFKLTVRFGNMAPIIRFVNITPAVLVKDTIVFSSITIPTGSYNYNAKVEISNSLEFENQCIFNKRLIGDFYNTNSVTQPGQITSNSCRTPVFTWYMSSTTTFGSQDILRQVYVNETSPGLYEDILNVNQGLQSNRYYQLDVDCSCAKTQQYESCQKPGKLFYCNPTEFNYVLSECNKKITFSEVRQCMTNVVGEVEWELLIKTAAVPTYTVYATYSSAIPNQFPYQVFTALLVPAGTVVTTPSTITGIKFRIKGDPCTDCAIEDLPEQDPGCCLTSNILTIAADCANNGVGATVTTSGLTPVQGCAVELYQNGTLVASSITDVSGEVVFSNLTKDVTYEIDVNVACDPDNCIEPMEYTHECIECSAKSVTANYNSVTQILSILLSSIDGGNTYTYKVDGNAFTNLTAIVLSNGVHTLQVTETYPDASICVYNGSVVVNNCLTTVLSSTYSWDLGTEILDITAIGGGVAPYTVTFGGVNYTGVTAGGISISTVGVTNGVQSIIVTDSNNCNATFNILVDRCVGFEGNAIYNCDTFDLLLNWNNGTAPFNYSVKNSSNVTITSGTTALSTETFNTTTILPNGDYILTITDANGCEDTDEFTIACICSPTPSFDIFRIGVIADTDPNTYLVTFDVSNIANFTYPLQLRVFGEGDACAEALATPFVLNIATAPPSGTQTVSDVEWLTTSDGSTSGWVQITDANGCTVCNAISIFA